MMWVAISIAYIRFYNGMKARDISRDELPYKSPLQPYAAYFAGALCFLIVFFSGFSVFFPGNWSVSGFLTNYVRSPFSAHPLSHICAPLTPPTTRRYTDFGLPLHCHLPRCLGHPGLEVAQL